MPKSKETKKPKKGRQDVLKMMGYNEEDESDDEDMEQQLAALLGEGGSKPAKVKQSPKLLDWSIIDAQVSSSMRDVDDDEDEEVTEEDENELMSELTDLVGNDQPDLLHPDPTSGKRSRSSSPQPQTGNSMVELLTSRKTVYESAIKTAQADGQSSKVRRLQRGLKTIDELLKSAKRGKSISEDDIPPMLAGSQNLSQKPTTTSPVPPVQIESPKPIKAPAVPPSPVKELSPESATPPVDTKILKLLEERQHEYKVAALHAKREGDKETALAHFRGIKQIDSLIKTAKDGKHVDTSQIPPSLDNKPVQPKTTTQPVKVINSEETSPPPPKQISEVNQAAAPTAPKNALEALEQRMQKYKISEAEATKEGNGGKARRMGRIVKQYQAAIRSHKAGKPVNFDELPVPPGFPPIPGFKETQQENLLAKANSLINANVDEDEPGPSKPAINQLPVPAVTQAARSKSPSQKGSKSPSPTSQKAAPKTPYEQQIAFLQNRQAAFKRAAIEAKTKGDRETALEYLRKMKGFDQQIEAAKSGIKVDIRNVPQPPIGHATHSHQDDTFEIIEGSESSSKQHRKSTPEEDVELYSRLLKTLKRQVEKARAFAQQMTHSGDVAGAERCDRLAETSQADYDYVKSCQRHGDPPPHFFYEEKTFKTEKIIPDLGSNEMELEVVQCMDVNMGGKDAKVVIEWEFPFPRDNPCKGRTEEGKGQQNLKFGEHFRVPFERKHKSNQRAVKSKILKLDVIQKGGFLRSDKSLGIVAVKLETLESHCEIHVVEEIKDGRNTMGKLEAYVRLRTPLLGSDSSLTREKWLHVEHRKRHHASPTTKGNSKHSTSKPSGRSTVNISSMEVLLLDIKIVEAKIGKFKQQGKVPPTDLRQEVQSLKQKHAETKKFLEEGSQHAKNEYSKCLAAQYKHFAAEAQAYTRQGKKDQMKLALTKKAYVQKEIEKYAV